MHEFKALRPCLMRRSLEKQGLSHRCVAARAE
jgi:hypothetical protein